MKRWNLMKAAVLAAVMALVTACNGMTEPGVGLKLAQSRKVEISGVEYELFFDIPSSREEPVPAKARITFDVARPQDIILDFRDGGVITQDEHILIPRRKVRRGRNSFEFEFTAPDQSLNRRDEFLYTLLVPDRARTVFPCFDQPDLKASYSLSLRIPEDWTAVSNSIQSGCTVDGGRKTVTFAPTEPLSTYLFSFVAGKFECDSILRGDRYIHLYHRETDPVRVSQCRDILGIVCTSLDAIEEYTGIGYPFSKYDCIALPDFQYGGMEHTGATLYNASRLFLGEHPTTEELMGRASLIAHETAHMWFGDLVTMKWFNDVWTKEVFANWFAARLIRPQFPAIDHHLGDMYDYYAGAYAEDRTPGSYAVRRPLDNLCDAGLIYGNIIYDKAPIVMDMLVNRMGEEAFRAGVRRYLNGFSYSNAGWDDLIGCLSEYADFDIGEWSRVWIEENGMPVFRITAEGCTVTAIQSDPLGRGNVWPEYVSCFAVGEDSARIVEMDVRDSITTVSLPFEVRHVIPNIDGESYGCFLVSQDEAGYLEGVYQSLADASGRMSVLMTLYENALRGRTDRNSFMEWISGAVFHEKEPLILGSMIDYGANLFWKTGCPHTFETALEKIASSPFNSMESRLMAFRKLCSIAVDGDICRELEEVWSSGSGYYGLTLGEREYTELAYQLMLRYPDSYGQIRSRQASRISNPDRRQTFEFVSRACDGSRQARDEFFEYLLSTEGRAVESRASKALSLLNHPLRDYESAEYIRPALEIIETVQREGDIFFPQVWCRSLLGGHEESRVKSEIEAFLSSRPDLNPLLAVKILQQI